MMSNFLKHPVLRKTLKPLPRPASGDTNSQSIAV